VHFTSFFLDRFVKALFSHGFNDSKGAWQNRSPKKFFPVKVVVPNIQNGKANVQIAASGILSLKSNLVRLRTPAVGRSAKSMAKALAWIKISRNRRL
jgi:hypothetical protein